MFWISPLYLQTWVGEGRRWKIKSCFFGWHLLQSNILKFPLFLFVPQPALNKIFFPSYEVDENMRDREIIYHYSSSSISRIRPKWCISCVTHENTQFLFSTYKCWDFQYLIFKALKSSLKYFLTLNFLHQNVPSIQFCIVARVRYVPKIWVHFLPL